MDIKAEILAMLDDRIREAERLYHASGNDDGSEMYMQGCWEEAKRLRERIAALGHEKK